MPAEFGLPIDAHVDPLGLHYGEGVFGPQPELRRLDTIRPSLRDPRCDGPDPVYAIAMDVGRPGDRDELQRRNLLFGVVAYAPGRLGQEPVRSQGHVHKISRKSGWSAPEIFEVWRGRALIYMQESAADDPGRCFAIDARPGSLAVVPPGWAHAVISADAREPLVFGAWCDRDYGFVYDEVRARNGLAWYPVLDEDGVLDWFHNPRYRCRELRVKSPRRYTELALDGDIPLYEYLTYRPEAIQWVSNPELRRDAWADFEP